MKKLAIIFIIFLFFMNWDVNSSIGAYVDIMYPKDGTVFHQRNVSIYGIASACCGDRLIYWEWLWEWSNGSYSENYSVNYKTRFEFYINISLYPGANKIYIFVKGASGKEGFGNITLYYDGPLANANGPYEGNVGIKINFHGSAYGGHKPYTWQWDFGDGFFSNQQNPSHIYSKIGIYRVILNVTDSMGYSDLNSTFVIIHKRDNIPPYIEIIKPSPGIYLNDRKILSFSIPIIIGKISIEVNAYDNETGIMSVAFYINDEMKFNDSKPPYEWLWNEYSLGKYEIKAMAYDFSMNYAMDSVKVMAFIS